MKKILHISKFYYPYYGGIEDVAFTIVSEMKDRYEQRVICFNHEHNGTIRTTLDGIEVIRVSSPVTISSQPIGLSYYRHLRQQIREFQPDIIHVHLPNPLIGACLLGIHYEGKIILHWHSDIIGKNALYSLYRRWEKRLLERADKIIATSREYVTLSEPLQPFADKIAILPNVVNEEKLRLQPEDQSIIEGIHKRFAGKKIVLFIGRHVPYKGIPLLIQACSFLPDDCVVLIGGTGEQTGYLQRLAEPMGDKIQFIGRVQDQHMRCYLHASTLFAFPSIDRREAFGVALGEALYCGLPAVSFRIDGSGVTWVNRDHYTGLVVEHQDPQEYARAITELLENDALRAQYSENAKQWVRANFLKDKIQSLASLYDPC